MQLECARIAQGARVGSDFNPTLVQLEWVGILFINHLINYFNPTLVQLESQHSVSLSALSCTHFNPTLVQLECDSCGNGGDSCDVFQSHIGAIRIGFGFIMAKDMMEFQSHIGAIRIKLERFTQI